MNTVTIFFERGRKTVTASANIRGVDMPMSDESTLNPYLRNRFHITDVLSRALALKKILDEPICINRVFK